MRQSPVQVVLERRGPMEIKGKGVMVTYFLVSLPD